MKLAHTIALCSLAAVCSIISQHALASLESPYSQLKNKEHNQLCLEASPNSDAVTLNQCADAATPATMDQWRTVEQSSGLFFIQNQYKNNTKTAECLRTFSNNDNVAMGNCHENNGTIEHYTMRLWKVVHIDKEHAQLENKYKQNNKKTLCLKVSNDNNKTLILANCPSNVSTDNSSQWSSDIFRRDTDHSTHGHE